MDQGASSVDTGAQGDTQASTPLTLIHPVRPSTQCPIHKKLREVYCETHQAAICVTCVYNDHPPPTCKTVLLQRKTKEDRKALEDLLPDSKSTLKDLQDIHDRATARQTDAEERLESEEQKIQAWREAKTDELEKECQRLVKQLQDSLQRKIGEVNTIAESKGNTLSTTWSSPLETLQEDAVACKKTLDDLDKHVAVAAATSVDSAATADAVEEVKQDLLHFARCARDFHLANKFGASVILPALGLDEQLGLGLKVLAEVSSKDASTGTGREGDVSLLQVELSACRERLQSCEAELNSHKIKVDQLQKNILAAQTTGAAETKRLHEDNAFLTAELTLRTKDFGYANKRAEKMEADKLRTEQLVHELKQEMKDLERNVESSRQPEAPSASPSPAYGGAACQGIESPEGLELRQLRQIAKSKSGWNDRVVRKDHVLKLPGDKVVVINGFWIRAAYDFLTGKTSVYPGPVNLAAPARDRSDYYCLNKSFEDRLEHYFDTFDKQPRIVADKNGHFPVKLLIFLFKEGATKEDAVASVSSGDYFDIDKTFQEYCVRMDIPVIKVQVLGGPPLSPHKTIRHYLENTKVKLDDFMTLLFIGQ